MIDRRFKRLGEKFAEADLLGMPIRIVVSSRNIKEGGVEVKKRIEEKAQLLKLRI